MKIALIVLLVFIYTHQVKVNYNSFSLKISYNFFIFFKKTIYYSRAKPLSTMKLPRKKWPIP